MRLKRELELVEKSEKKNVSGDEVTSQKKKKKENISGLEIDKTWT